MNKTLYEFLKKLEQTVGPHKLVKCICLGGIGFLMGMVMLPDDIQENNLIENLMENNKEEN